MDMSSNGSGPSELWGRQRFRASWAWPLAFPFLALALGTPARSQEPPQPAESVSEAARNAREHKANSTKNPKTFTTDDLARQHSEPTASASPLASLPESSSTNQAEESKPPATGCDNPDAERLKTELQAAQEELDQIRSKLSYNPTVISDGDLDLTNFKPGSSGVDVGSPPLLESKPLVPERVQEVSLEEKIQSLTRALRVACQPPEDAAIQVKLDQVEQQLALLQRQFDLDRTAYYSKTNYARDTAGTAALVAEQQQIQDLQSEVERLKGELAASKANQSAR